VDTIKKVKLSGGPEKTVTWIWIEAGHLKVEYYDFSEDAHRFFGNDIAYTITVNEMDKWVRTVNQNESSILTWMEHSFKSYFEIKKWLEENKIDFFTWTLKAGHSQARSDDLMETSPRTWKVAFEFAGKSTGERPYR
jgi:hypothetical protein